MVSGVFVPLKITAETFSYMKIANDSTLEVRRSMAVGFYSNPVNKTFVCWPGPDGHPFVQEYAHASGGAWSSPVQVGSNPFVDSHNYPTLIRGANGKLHVFYGSHNSTLRYARSANADSTAGTWTDTAISGATLASYPMPILADGGNIYVFYRYTQGSLHDDRPLRFIRSTDNGGSWSSPTTVISSNRADNMDEIYLGGVTHEHAHGSIDERFHLAWTIAGGGPEGHKHDRYHRNVYYAYFKPANEHFYDAAGTDLGTAISGAEMESNCLAYDSGTPIGRDTTYAPEVGVLDDGTVFLIFADLDVPMQVRRSGSSWVVDSGFIDVKDILDIEKVGSDTFRLYTQGSSSAGNVEGMVVYKRVSGQTTWTQESTIPIPTYVHSAAVIDNHQDPLRVLALENTFVKQYHGDRQVFVSGVGTIADALPMPLNGNKSNFFEAEKASKIVGQTWWESTYDTGASNSRYLTISESAGDNRDDVRLEFKVTVTSGTNLTFWGKSAGPNTSSNSFRFQIDNGPITVHHTGSTNAWEWHDSGSFSLTNGTHTIKVLDREDGTHLDKILLTSGTIDFDFEAESSPNLNYTGNWLTVVGGGASGSFIMWDGSNSTSSPPSANNLTYTLDVPIAGLYEVRLKMIGDTDKNSIWVKVDGATTSNSQNITRSDGWVWVHVPTTSSFTWTSVRNHQASDALVLFYLNQGNNTLRLGHREAGLLIDQVNLVSH